VVSPATPPVNPQVTTLLSQLDAPVNPEAIGLWPPAPGWILLTLLLLGALGVFIVWGIHRHRSTRYKKQAIKAMDAVCEETNPIKFATSCMALLKQTYISASPTSRNIISGLYGDAWLQQLYATCSLTKLPLEQQQALASICGDDKYDRTKPIDRRLIENACRYWIKQHHMPANQNRLPVVDDNRSAESQ